MTGIGQRLGRQPFTWATLAVALSAPVNDANIFEVFLPVPEKRKAFISFVPNSLIELKIFSPLLEKRPKSAADFRYAKTEPRDTFIGSRGNSMMISPPSIWRDVLLGSELAYFLSTGDALHDASDMAPIRTIKPMHMVRRR